MLWIELRRISGSDALTMERNTTMSGSTQVTDVTFTAAENTAEAFFAVAFTPETTTGNEATHGLLVNPTQLLTMGNMHILEVIKSATDENRNGHGIEVGKTYDIMTKALREYGIEVFNTAQRINASTLINPHMLHNPVVGSRLQYTVTSKTDLVPGSADFNEYNLGRTSDKFIAAYGVTRSTALANGNHTASQATETVKGVALPIEVLQAQSGKLYVRKTTGGRANGIKMVMLGATDKLDIAIAQVAGSGVVEQYLHTINTESVSRSVQSIARRYGATDTTQQLTFYTVLQAMKATV